jgi:glycopeptide antibiotics resistance protein
MPCRAKATLCDQTTESRRLSVALLMYLLAMIAVVTLLPFRFHWPSHWQFLLSIEPLDGVSNIGLFLPLGFLYRLSRKRQGDRGCLQTAVFGGTISLGLELAQLFLRGRYSSPMDVAANAIGACIGAMLYGRVERRFDQRLIGQLALELPLMTLFYLLMPLLWLNSLATGSEVSRLWLAPLLGLCGATVLAAVWRHRLQPAGVFSANVLALIVALWFLVSALPGLARRPWFFVLCSLGLAFVVRLQLLSPWLTGAHERRFELPTLRRVWPLYLTYVCLVALWPWPWVPHPWHVGLGFSEISDVPHVIPTLRVLEYIAAFTLLGYMLVEFRSRRDEPFSTTLRWLLTCGMIIGGLLEIVRGFHPDHIASLAQLIVAIGAALYGGMLHRLQLVTVQQLLANRPTPQTHDAGAPAVSASIPRCLPPRPG